MTDCITDKFYPAADLPSVFHFDAEYHKKIRTLTIVGVLF